VLIFLDLCERAKVRFFKLARKIPAIGNQIRDELAKINEGFKEEAVKRTKGAGFLTRLPNKPISDELIAKEVASYLELGMM